MTDPKPQQYKVNLLALGFRDPNGGEDCLNHALLLRRTASGVPAPWHWVQERSSVGEPVAFTTLNDNANALAVWVRIRNEGPDELEVVAEFDSGPHRLLGRGVSRPEKLCAGAEATVCIPLEGAELHQHGVDKVELKWDCKIRTTGKVAETPVVSSGGHTLYTTLLPPVEPWTLEPDQTHDLPWAELLYFVCEWARGAKTADQAAEAITRKVFDLGRTPYPPDPTQTYLKYSPGMNYTDFTTPTTKRVRAPGWFFCDRFLRRLQHVASADQGLVNCTDCATIVSTCANLLGCSLYQVRLAEQNFSTRPIIPLGSPPDSWSSELWVAHDVAWEGKLDETGRVWDACLAVDGRGNPESTPKEELVVAGRRLGRDTDEEGYNYRFLRPSLTKVLTLPKRFRLRRPIIPFSVDLPAVRALAVDGSLTTASNLILEVQRADAWKASIAATPLMADWKLTGLDPIPEIERASAWEASWMSSAPGPRKSVYVRAYVSLTEARARELLSDLIESTNRPAVRDPLTPPVGDECFGEPEAMIIFRQGRVVATLERSSAEPFPLYPHAEALSQFLSSLLF